MVNACRSELPTPRHAAEIAADVLRQRITASERMTTGAGNWVYEVRGERGASVVVRIMRSHDECAAGVYWSQTLRPLGVPLPELIAHHVGTGECERSWMVLQRLPGTDLEHAHTTMTPQQRLGVADGVAAAQQIVATNIPPGGGFGYVTWPRDWPHQSWGAVVRNQLMRSRRRIEQVGVVDPRHVDRVESLLPRFEAYFSAVSPIPFLDDTTTRNVIVHDGRLSGIVDVDSICYGDGLFPIGLTRMALLNLNEPSGYIDHWLARLDATAEQRRAVDLYTALFCVNFLAEQGQQFNRDTAPAIDPREVERLEMILDHLIDARL